MVRDGIVFVRGVRRLGFKEKFLSWCGWELSLHHSAAIVGFLMHQLVPAWCSDIKGLLLPGKKGER